MGHPAGVGIDAAWQLDAGKWSRPQVVEFPLLNLNYARRVEIAGRWLFGLIENGRAVLWRASPGPDKMDLVALLKAVGRRAEADMLCREILAKAEGGYGPAAMLWAAERPGCRHGLMPM